MDIYYFFRDCRMFRKNTGDKAGHDSELCVNTTNVYIEIWHVIWRASPPVFRMICCVVCVAYHSRLAVPQSGGPIEVATDQPNPRSVELFASMQLILRFCGDWKVKIEVYGNPNERLSNVPVFSYV